MKPKKSLRNFLLLTGSIVLTLSAANADTLYWDGGTADIGTDGNGLSNGAAGNWNTSLLNWDQGSGLAHVAWDNTDTLLNPADTAIFSGPAGNVTLTAPITVGGLQFKTTAYNITTGANTLSFGTGNNTILLDNTAAATITGIVGGAGNVILKASNPALGSGTITFTGASSGGWSGTTTIGPSMILTTTSTSTNVNRVLDSTSGITLNGGRIQFNRATNANLNAISDTAAITVNGGGIFSATSADAGGVNAIENIGAVTVNSGQMNFNWTNGASSGAQIIMTGLTRSGTSALTFSGNLGSTGRWKVTGAGTTAANGIIGSWATTGAANGIAAQTDYAVYSGDFVAAANIASSAQSTWSTVHAATSNYTMSALAAATISGGTKNINSVRATNDAVAVTASDPNITLTGHTLTTGDVVTFSAGTMPTGLTTGTAYFVVGTAADTIQVSATSGGAAITPTTTGATVRAAGGILLSSGNNLGTTGILNGNATTLNILQSGGAGVVTLPTTTAGNLHVTAGAGAIVINAPIENNTGTGVLTLVKNGSGNLTLSGVNTYTGGTVLNAGTLTYTNDNQLGLAGSRNITVNGTAALTGYDNSSLGQLSIGAGAIATISGHTRTFATVTGSGTLNFAQSDRTLSLVDASDFHGNLRTNAGGNSSHTIQFGSIGDDLGAGNLQYGGGTNDNSQGITFRLYNNAGPQIFDNRSIEFLSKNQGAATGSFRDATLQNANSNAVNTFVINTNLVNGSDRNHNFILGGANMGNNQFNGDIGDSTKGAYHTGNTGILSLQKSDAGKWILGGDNTYTGNTTVNAGNLEIGGSGTLGNVSLGVGNYAGNISIASTSSGRLTYNSSATQSLSGVVSGAGAVFVEEGTLLINGSTSTTNAFTVNGGTLGGTGTIGGSVSVAGGATLSPGASIESLASGAVTMASNSTFVYEAMNNTAEGADLLGVNGALLLTGVNLSFDLATAAALSGGGWIDGNKLTLISYILGGSEVTSGFTGYADDTSYIFGTNSWLFDYNDTTAGGNYGTDAVAAGQNRFVTMTVTVIPEPSTALLGALGAMLLLRRRR